MLSNWVMPIFIYNPFSYMLFFQNLFCFPHSSKLLIFFSCGYSFHTNIKKMSFIFLLNFIFSLSPLISNAVLSNLWCYHDATKFDFPTLYLIYLNFATLYWRLTTIIIIIFLLFWICLFLFSEKIYMYDQVYFWYFGMWQREGTIK